MNREILETAHESWVESEEYRLESFLEKVNFGERAEHILTVAKEKERIRILSDSMMEVAFNAEAAGFDQGFRRGIMFMMGMMRGELA